MFYRGLLPPIFGGSVCIPLFLNFGPGGIAPGLAERAPLLLMEDSHSVVISSNCIIEVLSAVFNVI